LVLISNQNQNQLIKMISNQNHNSKNRFQITISNHFSNDTQLWSAAAAITATMTCPV